MKKRFLPLLLSLALCLGLMVPTALADGDFEITDGVLTKYTGPGGDVVIPDGVTVIRNRAFYDCKNVTSVTIPDRVFSIGERAFAGTGLTSVTIPDSVTNMGEGVFEGCRSLTSITVEGGNKNYASEDGVLFNKSKTFLLQYPGGRTGTYEIPAGVTDILRGAFWNCISLTSVTIPDSVTSIWGNAFYFCTSLTSVTIPSSVTSIGNNAFCGCTSLTSVTIPDGVTFIGEYTFAGTGLTSVTIPDSVTSIWGNAFYFCTSLTSVTIPDSVTRIRDGAFSRCENLADVYYGGTEAQWKAIEIKEENDSLQSAAIHYNSAGPSNLAYASTQPVLVDSKSVELQAYALKDESGKPTNYVKLRDVAFILNGTSAQFQVGWDGAVNIETGKAYVPNGSEMTTPYSGDRAYETAAAETRINGSPAALDAIVLTDDRGGAYTYYKLRDLGQALGFNVGWSSADGIFIETDKPYDPSN